MKAFKSSFWSTTLFIVLLTILHFVEPEIEPTWRFISEYALGKYGILMSVAFIAWALAYLFLFFGLRKKIVSAIGKIGLTLLIISAIGLLIAGLFITDPATAEVKTTSGKLHAIGGTLGMAMPFASLFIGIALYKKAELQSNKRKVLWATVFAFIGFLVSAISLGYLFSQSNGKVNPDVWVGIPTRLEVLAYCVWLIVISQQQYQIEKK